jgi:hypothetical protein
MTSLQGHRVFPPLIALAILEISGMAQGQQALVRPNGECDYIVPSGSTCFVATGECWLESAFVGSVGRSNGISRASAESREQARNLASKRAP